MYVSESNCLPRRANSVSEGSHPRAAADPDDGKKSAKDAVTAEAPAAGLGDDVVFPDGGYGWVIMAAFSVNIMFVVQLGMVYALILREVFQELEMPKTGVATVMTFNQSFSLLFGLVTGGLVRRYGYRRVAVVGAVLNTVGMVLTGFAHSFVAFMVTYGVIVSAGAGLTTPAFSVALNSYFKRRRSLVTGLALGLTGASGVLFPHVVGLLLKYLGSSGTCLSCGALSLLALVAAALLDPVEQHRPRAPVECGGVSVHAAGVFADGLRRKGLGVRDGDEHPDAAAAAHGARPWRWLARLSAHLLDVRLLGSAATMNLLLGLAVSNMADITFKTMTPFILEERGQDTPSIATFLSVVSGTAALGKLSAPLLQTLAGLSSQGMYVGVLLVILCARTVLVMVTDSAWLLLLAVVLGLTKGVRAVFYNLVMPDNVELDQLASAIGLQAVFTGIFLLINGPIIGVIREKSSSYNVVIMTCNGITAFCILAWTVELLVGVVRRRNKQTSSRLT